MRVRVMMEAIALGVYLLFVIVAFGWRGWRQYRMTGDHGFRGFSGNRSPIARLGGGLLTLGACAGLAALLVAMLADRSSFSAGPRGYARAAGIVMMVIGAALALIAQVEMGTSWRVGLDPSEVTDLVTTGLFRWVRNPIFTAMLVVILGVLFTAPNILGWMAVVASLAGIEIQVRRVEEPYLIRIHCERYVSYARRVGRFVPGLGRIVRPAGAEQT